MPIRVTELKQKNASTAGRITLNGVHLEPHEYDTIILLSLYGFNLDLIPPSNTPRVNTPDLSMAGVEWEMKGPQGRSKACVESAFKNALRQSSNIIMDLRRLRSNEDKAIMELRKRFAQTRRCKHLLVITKNGKILDFRK